MPDSAFEYDGDPITLVANTPFPSSEQSLDIPMFENFDPNSSVKHFRLKFHATQSVAESLYHFKIAFFNSDMNAPGGAWEGSLVLIQDGWIGEAGESWGSGPNAEDRTTFVSDHEHYETTEGTFTPPDYVEVYEAEDGGSFWNTNVIEKVAKDDRLPAGGDWFLRITLDPDSPGDVTLHDFSFEFTHQEWRPRNLVGPIPLTEGWVCSNTFPVTDELYLILHRGRAYMYGLILDWLNFNTETEEDWFANFYDDATTKLVEADGVPEEARPSVNTIVPIRFYDFDRQSTVLGEYWEISINTDGSITFVERAGQRPDKLRLGGGSYSFVPMQVSWPIADQTHGPDTDVGTGLVWEVHNEFLNEGETASETWDWDSPIELAKHGGITHLRGKVHHNQTPPRDVPLYELGGIVDFDEGNFNGVKVHGTGIGQDFEFIQYLISEIPAGATVQFDASPSTGQEPLTYEWDFGDGSTGTGITPAHTYEEGGNYFVTLTVTDPRNRTDDAVKDVSRLFGSWATFVNGEGATINSPGVHVHFLSGDPATQIFKGSDVVSGVIPNAPGSHFVSTDNIDDYFTVDKNRLSNGTRRVDVHITSPQMPLETNSVVGRKYGVAVCIQPDGSHYRHEVECTAIGGGAHPNTYAHKLYQNVAGADTQLGTTVTNDDPICRISGDIPFSDIEAVSWNLGAGSVSIDDDAVPKSGKWGFFITGGLTLDLVEVTDNTFPPYPDNGEVVSIETWWPTEYEFDEFTLDP